MYACVTHYFQSGKLEVVMDSLVNLMPPDCELGPIDYLKEKLPKNWGRALKSLKRVHNMRNLTDTRECNDMLKLRLTACQPMEQMTAELAAVARFSARAAIVPGPVLVWATRFGVLGLVPGATGSPQDTRSRTS
jgi:hypothetical protein